MSGGYVIINYMSTIHKCDKCGKAIKENRINISFYDGKRKFFESVFNNFDFCENCAKSFTVNFKEFLRKIKK